MSFSSAIISLIKVAQAKGISFQWVVSFKNKNQMGQYEVRKGKRIISIKKGLSLKDTEEMIAHEICHALWDLSLKGKQVNRNSLKKMAIKTDLPTWLNLILNYWDDKETWQEERFCYYMQTRPSLVLHLFNQL